MQTVLTIFLKTPPYVWGLLVYLLFIGIKALKSRVVFVPQLFVFPLVMFALKSYVLTNTSKEVVIAYVVSLFATLGVGFLSAQRMRAQFFKDKLAVKLSGSVETLVVSVLFFATKYVFGCLQATNPALCASLVVLDASLSGGFSGLMLGRAFGITYRLFS